MKLIKKIIEKTGEGEVKMIPQEAEDMWHLYNLIAIHDLVSGVTFRREQFESSTGSMSSNKVRIYITIDVEEIEYDAHAATMRLKGTNAKENDHIKLGQYHTLELALDRAVSIQKHQWDRIYLERIERACDPQKSADAAAIVMQPGLAHICLIGSHMTITRARIEVALPRKRLGDTSKAEKAVAKFYESILDAMLRNVDFKIVKVVIIASPGYTNEEYFNYIKDEAVKRDIRDILENRQKFMLVHSSSGQKHALNEILADPKVAAQISDTKAFAEVKVLKDFFDMMSDDQDRAYYGYNHVFHANEQKAIDTLLVTDDLFRSADVGTRRKYVELVESVENNGGNVFIFSAQHPSGQDLNKMTGVAAILRFPLPEIDDIDQHHDDSHTAATTQHNHHDTEEKKR